MTKIGFGRAVRLFFDQAIERITERIREVKEAVADDRRAGNEP